MMMMICCILYRVYNNYSECIISIIIAVHKIWNDTCSYYYVSKSYASIYNVSAMKVHRLPIVSRSQTLSEGSGSLQMSGYYNMSTSRAPACS